MYLYISEYDIYDNLMNQLIFISGSDSEAPVTPIRQTRRTRKDSASSLEKGI